MNDRCSDQDLLEDARQGVPDAFDRLYAEHARPVLTFLVGMLGDRNEAEDELQETFVAFAKALPRLASETPVRAYLLKTARNRALNRWRSEKRRRRMADRYEVLIRLRNDAPPDGATVAELEEERTRLNRALANLPEAEREVVLLRTQGELGVRGAAEVLKIPQGTAATRYRTALGRLREWLS